MQQQKDHVRRSFSMTGIAAGLLIAGAGALICSRLLEGASPQVPLAWSLGMAMEMAAYVAVVALVDAQRPVAGYAAGAVMLMALRWAITLAGAGLAGMQSGASLWRGVEMIQTLAWPRLAALGFAAVATFPVRDLLPGGGEAAQPARPKKKLEDNEAMLLFGADSSGEMSADELAEGQVAARGGALVEQQPAIEGSIALPLRVVLKNVAAMSNNGGESQVPDVEIEVPLALIVPQLKEGKVVVAARDLQPHLPQGVSIDQETFELPLREAVERVPREYLQSPPASPPAWMRVEGIAEERLFTAA